MWQETKHGLYKQFNFEDFDGAFDFMTKVAKLANQMHHHPRWENEWSVVQIWLRSHSEGGKITDKDHQLAEAIDGLVGVRTGTPETIDEPHLYRVKMFADGGSRGNPGPSASGFVILDAEGDKVVVDKGLYLGVTTNNQAEYTALKIGLEEAERLGAREVHVYMDSLLVVNQMNGLFKIKNRELIPIHDAIKRQAQVFDKVTYQHVPREFNRLADAAVNRALDDQLQIT